jgi:hypothetical protein
MIATRLSAVWQVAGVAAAALCCYLVSQSVAAERAGLNKVDRQIAETHDDIARLQMEIGVRARMGQLESWNRDVLALQAPRPSQFVASGVQLASLYGRKGQPALQLDPAIAAQQGSPTNVSYQPAAPQAPAAPPSATAASNGATASEAAPAQPLLRSATFIRPAPDRLGGAQLSAPAAPVVQKASLETVKTAMPNKVSFAPAKAPAAKAASAPVKLAARDPIKSLLPDDIGALAAREAKGSSKAAR